MNAETIREHLRHQPFQPFRIFLSDGSAHGVRHPEMAIVGRRDVVIGLPEEVDDFPERFIFCDLLHVTRIEPINGRGARRKSSGK